MTSTRKLGVLAVASLLMGVGLLARAKLGAEPRPSPREASNQPATVEAKSPSATEVSEAALAAPSRGSARVSARASAATPGLVAPSPAPPASVAPSAASVRSPIASRDAETSSPPPLAPSAPVAAAPASSEAPPVLRKPRRVSLVRLAAWSKPGLCSTTEEVNSTRDKLTAHFRRFDGGDGGSLLLDPRLPANSETAVLGLLGQARTEANRSLGLQPPPPTVFVYFDQRLMKAAACINEDVVAFYDGALHLVLGRDDLQQSVTHEYAHHALFSSGLVGPAWAQEGIAMNLAGETWWQQRSRLQSLLRAPFSAEQMDELIPYKLSAEQAALFYVQAALTVRCLVRRRGWSLQQLADALRGGSSDDSVSYALPELTESSFLGACAALN